jgi:hypothetical protein
LPILTLKTGKLAGFGQNFRKIKKFWEKLKDFEKNACKTALG